MQTANRRFARREERHLAMIVGPCFVSEDRPSMVCGCGVLLRMARTAGIICLAMPVIRGPVRRWQLELIREESRINRRRQREIVSQSLLSGANNLQPPASGLVDTCSWAGSEPGREVLVWEVSIDSWETHW